MHPSDSASCLGVASAAPSANSFSFFLLLYNVAPLHSQTLSLSAHFVFHCPSFLCVCLYSLPGAVEGTLPSFRGGRGWCSIKEKGHLSGVRARTNNSPRPPFPPHSAESLCIKYIVCSPLHSFFFFFFPALPVSVRKWTPAVVAHRAVCVWHALGKQDTQCMPRQIKKRAEVDLLVLKNARVFCLILGLPGQHCFSCILQNS